jgi:hypothetical protein
MKKRLTKVPPAIQLTGAKFLYFSVNESAFRFLTSLIANPA